MFPMRKILFAVFVAVVFLAVPVVSFTVAAQDEILFDIDRGKNTGASGWNRLTQYFNDLFYGDGKVSFDVSQMRDDFVSQGVQVSDVMINIEKDKILDLEYDFNGCEYEFVSNVSDEVNLYRVTVNTEEVVGGFWQGFRSWLGFSPTVTLANRDYISNLYVQHIFSLDLPISDSDATASDRTYLKSASQMGITTDEIREHYDLDSLEYNGSGIKVAVLDTGIFLSSEYDAYGDNFFALSAIADDNTTVDYCGHGSHVCSVLGGKYVDIDGNVFEGMAPGAEIYSIRVLNAKGSGTETDIIRGLNMAVDLDVDIVSMSLGGFIPAFSAMYDAIQRVRAEGIIVVAAAGNSAETYPASPAVWDGVISVGSLDKNGFLSFYSNLNFDVGAIGQDVTAPAYSKNTGRFTWVTMSGTSMATPVVSGLLAVYLESEPILKGKAENILGNVKKSGDYENPAVPEELFSIASWWNDYYYSFPEFDIVGAIEASALSYPDRSNMMDFGSIGFWRWSGKNP